ncbi:hypothetical protein OIE68_37090 [Nocardia vinacea]|uniref:Uncharacterized protein n=1 Tax=Nocardia vinacea TaxID=96468 RepID=A0ABZ1YJT4_9NOCA|nr:hypothetical protein OIE68_37090 [Nocardia vinacea]
MSRPVHADAAQHQGGALFACPHSFDLVDDQPAERAEVLFVGGPGAARMAGRDEAVRADSFEVAGLGSGRIHPPSLIAGRRESAKIRVIPDGRCR